MVVPRPNRSLVERILYGIRVGTTGTVRGYGINASPSLTKSRVVAARRTNNTTPIGGRSSQIDIFDTITGTGTSTFALTKRPIPDSWNVSLNGITLVDGADYSIVGQTLTVLDPVDLFGGASVGDPWTLQVQYDYLTGVPRSPTDLIDSWSITTNKAVSNSTTGVPYLDVGTVVTSAEVTVSGVMTDIAVGIHKSVGNYVSAQYDEVGTHQLRILTTRNGTDENTGLGASQVQTDASIAAGSVLKLIANWTTGAVELFVNGVSMLSGTLAAAQLSALDNPTEVCFRTPNAGAIFDDLKANGVLVDDFNRADAGQLGTSSSGAVWRQE